MISCLLLDFIIITVFGLSFLALLLLLSRLHADLCLLSTVLSNNCFYLSGHELGFDLLFYTLFFSGRMIRVGLAFYISIQTKQIGHFAFEHTYNTHILSGTPL